MDSNSKTMRVLLAILSLAVLATIGTIFYHLLQTGYEVETAVLASAEQSETFQGVYVRNEKVLKYDGDGIVSYNVSDGGKIEKNGIIAEVYTNQAAIGINQQIAALRSELETLNRISNPGILQNAQPSELANQVARYYEEIAYYRDCGDFSKLFDAKENFQISLSAYQLVVDQRSEDIQERIDAVQEQIEQLQEQKSEPKDVITASDSAYFVSYADGYELQFTVDTLKDVTVEQITSVHDNSTLQGQNIIGKTIDGFGWYMLGVIDNSRLVYQVGDNVTLKLSSTGNTANATIYDLHTDGDNAQTVVVLYCKSMTSDFVKNRTERVEMIKDSCEGIQVPRSAIRFKDVEESTVNVLTNEESKIVTTYRGVYVMDGENAEFRKLKVIYEGDDYVLSSLNAGDGYLILYDSIIVEGIDADEE